MPKLDHYDPSAETHTERPRRGAGGGTVIALQRRLDTNRLTEEDERLIARAKRIRELRRASKTFVQVAAEMGEREDSIRDFSKRGIYNAIVTWLEKAERDVESAAAQTLDKQHRETIRRFVPAALHRLGGHLKHGLTPAGEIVPSKAADNAMELVLKGAGLLESETSGARPIYIDKLVIQQEVAREREDDDAIETTCREIAPA